MPEATPADVSDSALPFSFPAVLGKKVTAAFDGDRLTSDGGALLLSMAERALGICDAAAKPNWPVIAPHAGRPMPTKCG